MIKTPHPKPVDHIKAHPEESFSLIPHEKLLAIHAALLKCRMLEQRVAALFQQGKLESGIYTSSANEASAAAIALELQPADALSIVQGDWLPAFVKRLSLDNLFRTLAPSAAQHRGLQPFTPADALAENVLLAVDATQQAEIVEKHAAAVHDGKTGAAIAAFLSPRGETVEWRKLVNSATSRKLPVVLVRHLDQPSQDQQNTRRSRNPEALLNGVPVMAVDATDPVALYRVACEAIARARQGRGATLIHCVPAPVPADKAAEAASCQRSILDPVTKMETYLKGKQMDVERHNRQIVTEFGRELDLATRFLDA